MLIVWGYFCNAGRVELVHARDELFARSFPITVCMAGVLAAADEGFPVNRGVRGFGIVNNLLLRDFGLQDPC
jgi:hypothetical protein